MVCAVCARPLNWWKPPTGDPEWIHPFDAEIEDHPVIPVPLGEVHTEGRCDFCHAPRPQKVLPVRPFMTVEPVPMPIDQASGGDWGCCLECAQLIDSGQWSAVTRRAAAEFERRHGIAMPDQVRTSLNRLHRQVRKNVTGLTRPL